MDTMIIGIAGGTGSGKTTLTRKLQETFGPDVSVVYHDNYYKRHDGMTYEERASLNYDHPDAFDTPPDGRASQTAFGRSDHPVPRLRLHCPQPL